MPSSRKLSLLAAAAAVLLSAAPAAANDKFAGDWKLDRIEEGSGAPAPEIDMSVVVADERLDVAQKIRREGKEEREFSYTLVTDGEARDVPGLDRVRKGLIAKWKGKKLRVEYMAEENGSDYEITEIWKLKKGDLEVRTMISVPVLGRNISWKAVYTRP